MPADFAGLEQEALNRWESEAKRPWLRVGTALCGQAAGGLEVVEALRNALESQGVDARLSEVGCIGLCFAEPLLDVQLPGGPRVFYGNFDPDRAGDVVAGHVAAGQPVSELALGYLAPSDAVDDFVPPDGLRDLALHPNARLGEPGGAEERGQHRPAGHLPVHRQRRLSCAQPGPDWR